ncbi:MAG TPA: hypothetical protein PKG54_07350 [Phycisphaerae bacterium]|jgi:hypothetical protein|nr:hypothetical protein [Phycisphaerae bacterium]HOB74326.1 hypothetical protein [Phycisphaerae bacterium]HOJ53083.1 hypothetical protein [Phycisphaerae bacterium]HOL24820.1 hypothetical protein [Phycisphaerae bacterium]HPP19356.1 hypothetical protein [Phycisphaerae bacterium]
MVQFERIGDLDIDQDLSFQQRMWMIQRVGWVLMVLVLIAILLGLAGAGPLGRASTSAADGAITVKYDRFWRYSRPTKLQVRFDARPDSEGFARIWVDRQYLTQLILQGVVPEPSRVELSEDRLTYALPVAAAGTTTVEFQIQPDAWGRLNGRMGIPAGAEVAFRQFIYP